MEILFSCCLSLSFLENSLFPLYAKNDLNAITAESQMQGFPWHFRQEGQHCLLFSSVLRRLTFGPSYSLYYFSFLVKGKTIGLEGIANKER